MKIIIETTPLNDGERKCNPMNSREKIEISLERLQSRIEHRIGINPDDNTLINYLWEVQKLRAQNSFTIRTGDPPFRFGSVNQPTNDLYGE